MCRGYTRLESEPGQALICSKTWTTISPDAVGTERWRGAQGHSSPGWRSASRCKRNNSLVTSGGLEY